jgi:hypothetical protein
MACGSLPATLGRAEVPFPTAASPTSDTFWELLDGIKDRGVLKTHFAMLGGEVLPVL